jgi:Zn-finger nucleic acid-binding protein
MAKAVNREIGYAVIAKCPADPKDMEKIKRHVYFYKCRRCGGVFLDERKFK